MRKAKQQIDPEAALVVRALLPEWARDVQCPKCQAIMMPKKAKPDKQWGETLTWQCHSCLSVVTLTETVRNIIMPGTFDSSFYDWREIANVSPPVDLVEIPKVPVFTGVVGTPPSPWKTAVLSKVVWDQFWYNYKKGITRDQLVDLVVAKGKPYNAKLRELVDSIPQWITARTGFVVKINKVSGNFDIIGKTTGNPNLFPYSDAAYRRKQKLK